MKRSRFSFRVRGASEKSGLISRSSTPAFGMQDTPEPTRYSMNNFGYNFNTSSYRGSNIGFLEEFSESAEEDVYIPPMRRVLSAPVTATIATLHKAALQRAMSSEGKLTLAPIEEVEPTVQLVEDVTLISEGEESIFTSNDGRATDASSMSSKSSFESTPKQGQIDTSIEKQLSNATPIKQPSIPQINEDSLTFLPILRSTSTTPPKEAISTSLKHRLPSMLLSNSLSIPLVEELNGVLSRELTVSAVTADEKAVSVPAEPDTVAKSEKEVISELTADKSVDGSSKVDHATSLIDDNLNEVSTRTKTIADMEQDTMIEQKSEDIPPISQEVTDKQKATKKKNRAKRVSKGRKPSVLKSFSLKLRLLMQKSNKQQNPPIDEQ